MDTIDAGCKQEEDFRRFTLDNRVKYGTWDGLSRECANCLDLINPERLKAINAKLCVVCADREEKRR